MGGPDRHQRDLGKAVELLSACMWALVNEPGVAVPDVRAGLALDLETLAYLDVRELPDGFTRTKAP